MKKLGLLFCMLSVSTSLAYAEGLDAASQTALQQTKEMLMNQQNRQKTIGEDKSGKSAAGDSQLRNTLGSQENINQAYGIASGVFQQLVQQTGGDPQKLNQLLSELQRNPASLEQHLTPEQKSQLEALAKKVEQEKSAMAPH